MVVFLSNLFRVIKNLVFYLFEVFRRSCRAWGKYWCRRFYGYCELKRIYKHCPAFGHTRTRRLEICLSRSRRPKIREITNILNSCVEDGTFEDYTQRMTYLKVCNDLLIEEKGICKHRDQQFLLAFRDSLNTIWTYRCLAAKVEKLRSTVFEPDFEEHEQKLAKVYENMFPGDECEGRISRQWQVLGFQTSNPITDLRGAGFLAVECLLYFGERHFDLAKSLLQRSYHPQAGFPFACVSIQITFWAYHLIVSGLGRAHFYNAMEKLIELENRCEKTDALYKLGGYDAFNKDWTVDLMALFYEFYVAIFTKFVRYWIDSNPTNIMDFGKVKKDFEKVLTKSLEKTGSLLEKAKFEPEINPCEDEDKAEAAFAANQGNYYFEENHPLVSDSEYAPIQCYDKLQAEEAATAAAATVQ